MDADAYLINKNYVTENGVKAVTETLEQILVSVGSITRNEYFSAGQNGLAPSIVLKTNAVNYSGQNEVKFENKRYSVYRSYRDPETDTIELYLSLNQGTYSCVLKSVASNTMDEEGFRTKTYHSYNTTCNIVKTSDIQINEASAEGISVDITAKVRISDYLSSIIVVDGKKVKPSIVVIEDAEYSIYKAIINDTTVELVLVESENGWI